MNNKIELTYVTFEQAKWLKEKGFDILNCKSGYHGDFGSLEGDLYLFLGTYTFLDDVLIRNNCEWKIQRPEQWQVIEWLRVNHGIWISALECNDKSGFYWRILEESGHSSATFKTPQEAYSAAFNYIKQKELI